VLGHSGLLEKVGLVLDESGVGGGGLLASGDAAKELILGEILLVTLRGLRAKSQVQNLEGTQDVILDDSVLDLVLSIVGQLVGDLLIGDLLNGEGGVEAISGSLDVEGSGATFRVGSSGEAVSLAVAGQESVKEGLGDSGLAAVGQGLDELDGTGVDEEAGESNGKAAEGLSLGELSGLASLGLLGGEGEAAVTSNDTLSKVHKGAVFDLATVVFGENGQDILDRGRSESDIQAPLGISNGEVLGALGSKVGGGGANSLGVSLSKGLKDGLGDDSVLGESRKAKGLVSASAD
jgi:hypothetical protein